MGSFGFGNLLSDCGFYGTRFSAGVSSSSFFPWLAPLLGESIA
jgi:hypothetical protein